MTLDALFITALPPAVETLVSQLAADSDVQGLARPSDTATTRGDYGRYMNHILLLSARSPLAQSEIANRRIWAVILDRAGADRRGLLDALRVIEG